MKRIAYLLSAIAVCGAIVCSCNGDNAGAAKEKTVKTTDSTATAGSIVYFDLDRVLGEYQMSIDLQAQVKAQVEAIQKDLDRKQKKLEREMAQFYDNMQRNLMTQAVAQEKGQKLSEEKNSLDALAMSKSQEIQIMQQQVLDKIAFAINEYVKTYNEAKQYAMILSTQGGLLKAPVCIAQDYLDITDDIVEGLNEQYAAGQQAVADSLSAK